MKLVCSYCKRSMGEKEPLDDPRLSHSICGVCKIQADAQIEAYRNHGCGGLFLTTCNRQVCLDCGAGGRNL